MISEITLPANYPFSSGDEVMGGLKKVCFTFGPNGSGKTTISRLLASENKSTDSQAITWSSHSRLRIYVYNRDFFNENYSANSSIPGVFTIGKDSIKIQQAISDLNEDANKERGRKESAENQLAQTKSELKQLEEQLINDAWSIKASMPEILIKNLRGARKSKSDYWKRLRKIINRISTNTTCPEIQDLTKRAKVLFSESTDLIPQLPSLPLQELLNSESAEVFSTEIVGTSSPDIANLINKLNNSNWVAQGRHYLTGDQCPFCQQHTITPTFLSELEEYFDQNYSNNIDELENKFRDYKEQSGRILKAAKEAVKSHKDFFDTETFLRILFELEEQLQMNFQELKAKADNPIYIPSINSSEHLCEALGTCYTEAIRRIQEQNALIQNLSSEKKQLENEIWLYLAKCTSERYFRDIKKIKELTKKIRGLTTSISSIDQHLREILQSINDYERKTTNIYETADSINSLLKLSGFSSFSLKVASDKKSYRIERNNGTLVDNTLSEGEANFLAFLYFFHLCSGSYKTYGTVEDRIIVIDDPITSMDSDILFTVSTLVRRLANSARQSDSNIKQLFVFTHNISFHREVTFIRKEEGDPETSYFTINKVDGGSVIQKHPRNPIASTYELLWKDLFRPDCSSLTAQNISRRIIETFAKFIGKFEADDIIQKMESPSREIARSWLAWANAGSHDPFDDETFMNSQATTEIQKDTLRKVFKAAGYEDHYNRMVMLCASIQ